MIPQLRFPEFTDDWQASHLSSFLSPSRTKNDNLEFNKSQVLSVAAEAGVVNQIKYHGRSYAGVSVKPYNVIRKGEMVYTKSPLKVYPYGIIKLNEAEDGIVSTLYAVYQVNKKTSGKFLDYYFYHPLRINKYLKPLVNIGAKNDMKINNEAVLKGHIIAPSFEEQQKIADFLVTVDDKISTLEQKVEKLETYKHGVMQKIFTRRIRFARSDGSQYPEWETKRLDEIYSFIVTLPLSRAYLSYDYDTYKGAYKYIHYGDIHTKLPMHLDTENTDDPLPLIFKAPKIISSSYLNDKLSNSTPTCKPGDIVMADASEDYKDIGKSVEIVSTGNRTVAGLHTILLRPYKKIALGFGAYLFTSSNVRRQITRLATGVSVLGISKTNLLHVEFDLPCEEEQQKIADFLSAIDQKITLTKQQLEKTKKFKKGLLQRMFV